MYLRRVLGVSLLSSFLFACNNNDSTSTVNDTAQSNADSVYIGERADATLTIDNVGTFIRSALATREVSFSASSVSTLLPNASTKKSTGNINTTTTCINEGQATDFGSIDNNTKLGSITTTLKQCLVKDTVFDGSMTTAVSSYDLNHKQASVFSITFDSLSMSKSARSITLIGTLETQTQPSVNTIKSHFNIHMKAHSGEEVLSDMQTDITKNSDYTVNSTLNGKICVDSQGCANLQTVTAFTVDYSGVLEAGRFVLIGAKGSQSEITVLAQNRIQIKVDKEGDGNYEDQKIVNQ